MLPEIALKLAVVAIPFLVVGGLLALNGRRQQREDDRVTRQIAVTDAIHRELGAVAAPEVRQDWRGHWTVSVRLPFEQKAIVGAVVSTIYACFAKRHPRDAAKLRIVLTRKRASGNVLRALPRAA